MPKTARKERVGLKEDYLKKDVPQFVLQSVTVVLRCGFSRQTGSPVRRNPARTDIPEWEDAWMRR